MKKNIKRICTGMLAVTGLFSLAGCSLVNSELDGDILSDVTKELEATNELLEETKGLLEDQNAKIEELLNNQNSTLSLEEAYKLIELAQTKLYMNYEGITDNLTITSKNAEDGYEYDVVTFVYKDNEGNKYFASESSYNNISMYKDVVYKKDANVYRYYAEMEDKEKVAYSYPSVDAYLSQRTINLGELMGDLHRIEEDSITKVEKLENGNYKICATLYSFEDDGNMYAIIETEITSDAKIVAINEEFCSISDMSNIVDAEREYDYEYYSFSINAEFKYGEVNVTKLTELVNEAMVYEAE